MVTLEEAQRILNAHVKQTEGTKECSLSEALGRRIGEDLAARTDQPPFPRSPLDGYAVRAGDIRGACAQNPAVLNVAGELPAGVPAVQSLGPGQAVRIMTGAPIPEGADAVIRQEDTDYGEEKVQIYRSVKPCENICFQGEDYRAGTHVIRNGERMDAVNIALAAGMGYERVRVKKKPAVAVLTTGSELQEPGRPLKPGAVYDSNRYLVEARLREWGITPFYAGRIEDDAGKAAGCLAGISKEADLIITTGGVSVGRMDIMHDVIERLGAERLFWRVKLKPGSPAMASVYEGAVIISLSGNPFGAAAGMELLVRPALYHMTGDSALAPVRQQAVMENGFPKKSGSRRFVRAVWASGMVRVPEGSHSSGSLSSMKGCNCLIDIPAGNEGLCKGDSVWIILL
ncbi:molybdopterin molybdotransferase MoeA [[Clostridium] hylemonae]|uniref:molybdopterin molybdotransferase MoeA n=1 Tax=[Clostridium] hylemonae TaxID=89153 RepID=UPI001D07F6FE|nr:gephyrin-like molybdotransferase Glp [[Clostridium] hylemonae]MCB7522119.1 molybdopterin molybdotransferase MoeA [[Clostridium] hylemonae]